MACIVILRETHFNYYFTVVSLRQLERQTVREKERVSEHLKTVEQHYNRQIEGLQQKLRAVESERNLMMV